ncbi:hypothetical protein HTZ77_24330 [Nonomuraea sp. SMC257]|uniref:Uncharacterized protein n=1 Tax=Nonomuraea montanisoli TaxID=2741721 RepID=A0A7Y6IA88_9ACTN|nr:DUF6071 family protein [Nonomuraea montanisoli]NUW34542.1 hypothetical protein [Nonomuraea montanisoli]
MIRFLIANGCSYTRGAELDDPGREAWPAVLAGQLGIPFVNLACDGGSNRRIVRTTVGNLHRLCAENGVSPAETLVFCMWTGLTRGECRGRRPDPGNRPDLPYETDWHRLGRWRIAEGDTVSQAYFSRLWDQRGAAVDFFTDWILLDSFLRDSGALARYAFAWDVLPRKLGRQAVDVAGGLAQATVYGGDPTDAEQSFYNAIQRNFSVGKLYHPLAAAHVYFAQELAAWTRTGLGVGSPPSTNYFSKG